MVVSLGTLWPLLSWRGTGERQVKGDDDERAGRAARGGTASPVQADVMGQKRIGR